MYTVGAIDFELEALSSDTCKALIAMMDADGSGLLGFEEFSDLWRDLLKWLVRLSTQPYKMVCWSVGNSFLGGQRQDGVYTNLFFK